MLLEANEWVDSFQSTRYYGFFSNFHYTALIKQSGTSDMEKLSLVNVCKTFGTGDNIMEMLWEESKAAAAQK